MLGKLNMYYETNGISAKSYINKNSNGNSFVAPQRITFYPLPPGDAKGVHSVGMGEWRFHQNAAPIFDNKTGYCPRLSTAPCS